MDFQNFVVPPCDPYVSCATTSHAGLATLLAEWQRIQYHTSRPSIPTYNYQKALVALRPTELHGPACYLPPTTLSKDRWQSILREDIHLCQDVLRTMLMSCGAHPRSKRTGDNLIIPPTLSPYWQQDQSNKNYPRGLPWNPSTGSVAES